MFLHFLGLFYADILILKEKNVYHLDFFFTVLSVKIKNTELKFALMI